MTKQFKVNHYTGERFNKLDVKSKIDSVLTNIYSEVAKQNSKEELNIFAEIANENQKAGLYEDKLELEHKLSEAVKEAAEGKLNYRGSFVGKLNPKDQMASTKLPVNLVPTELIRETAKAMEYGAFKAPRKDGKFGYGAWNWRESGVSYTIMVSAIIRHALELLDGKDTADDSKVSHLGHIAAGVGIILDAKKNGVLRDDRPKLRSSNDSSKS